MEKHRTFMGKEKLTILRTWLNSNKSSFNEIKWPPQHFKNQRAKANPFEYPQKKKKIKIFLKIFFQIISSSCNPSIWPCLSPGIAHCTMNRVGVGERGPPWDGVSMGWGERMTKRWEREREIISGFHWKSAALDSPSSNLFLHDFQASFS